MTVKPPSIRGLARHTNSIYCIVIERWQSAISARGHELNRRPRPCDLYSETGTDLTEELTHG